MKLLWLWLAIPTMFVLASSPLPVAADSSVVVLGVRSLDGDDDEARDVSNALRQAAKKIQGFQVSDRDVSLAQMSLAHGCDEPDARCMADIASTLKVDRLIYGTTARSGGEVQIALFSFDAVSGQVESSIEQKVPAERMEGPNLGPSAQALMERLAGKRALGSLRIVGDSPGAEVAIDGDPVGELNPRGELLLSEIAAGKHSVTVHDPVEDRVRDVPVMVGENATATLRVVLKPADAPLVEEPASAFAGMEAPEDLQPSKLRRVLGWTSIGLALGLTGATIYSWVRIGNINDDPYLKEYRAAFPPNVQDVCVAAEAGTLAHKHPSQAGLESKANSLCNEADTLEVLQYVFLGSAIVFGGVGTYLLVTDPLRKQQRVSFRPSYRHGQAMLNATVQF
ncbi:MAG: hypothetical protein QM778_26975 [Myxococcales bacterium]